MEKSNISVTFFLTILLALTGSVISVCANIHEICGNLYAQPFPPQKTQIQAQTVHGVFRIIVCSETTTQYLKYR